MSLETPRLILRRWRLSDAPFLFRYASHPKVGPAAGWTPHRGVLESRWIIARTLSAPETYALELKSVGHPVGCVELYIGRESSFPLPEDEGELGYWLGAPFWGRGLMTEAVEAVVRHAFADLRLKKLWCGYYDGNLRSKRVAEKCGFRYHHFVAHAPSRIEGDRRTGHAVCLTAEDCISRSQEPSDRRES